MVAAADTKALRLDATKRRWFVIFMLTALTSFRGGLPAAFAQTQQLDSLYRSMAESQAEFNRQAMLRQQQTSARVEPVPRSPLTINASTNNAPAINSVQTPSTSPSLATSNVQSNWFQTELANIATSVRQLLPELQRASVSFPVIRELLSDVYQLDAEATSLLTRLQSSERWETLYASYQAMDLRWRGVLVSFESGIGA